MKPTPANAPLDYAPPARKRARIVRRVLLAGLLGFAVFAAWRSVPSLVSRLQLASLYRQAESFRVAVPTTGSTDNPTHRLIRQLGHVVHPTVFSGMLQRGELRRLLHVGWAREPSGRHDIHFGAVFDHGANAVPRFTYELPRRWGVNDPSEEGAATVIASAIDPADPSTAVIEIQSENRRWQFRFTLTEMDTIGREMIELPAVRPLTSAPASSAP